MHFLFTSEIFNVDTYFACRESVDGWRWWTFDSLAKHWRTSLNRMTIVQPGAMHINVAGNQYVFIAMSS